MAGTTAAALKTALITAMGNEAALDGIPKAYGDPGELGRTEHIWIGAATDGESFNPTFRAGRKRREEEYTIDVTVMVSSMARPEINEARAVTIGTVIAEMLADDPQVNAVTNLMWCALDAWELDTIETGEGPQTTYTLTLRAKGRLL